MNNTLVFSKACLNKQPAIYRGAITPISAPNTNSGGQNVTLETSDFLNWHKRQVKRQ